MMKVSELAAEAEALLPAGSEARARTVVCRAYYAAYHACLISAQKAGYSFAKGMGGTHQHLFSFLRNAQNQKLKKAGVRLEDMFDQRINADYRLGVAVTPTLADESVESLAEILGILSLSP